MRRLLILAACAVLPATAAGCIDDPAALAGDPIPLSSEEAEILGVTVWRDILTKQQDALADAANVQSLIDFVRQADDGVIEVELKVIEECEFSGEREVDGIVTGEVDPEGNGFVQVENVQRWDGCSLSLGNDRIQLTGDPDINSRIRYDFTAAGGLDVDGRMEGNVIIQFPDGRVGGCGYSVTFSGAESLTTGRFVFRAKGIACGQNVNLRQEL
jgi:hypothetical protein